MESDLASCLWLVLVRIPLSSGYVCRATRQKHLPEVVTAVVPIMRHDGHSLRVMRGFNYTIDVMPEQNAVRIAWKAGQGRSASAQTSVVDVRKTVVWLENGTTTVMACAFVTVEAARAWAVCRHICLIPPSQSARAA